MLDLVGSPSGLPKAGSAKRKAPRKALLEFAHNPQNTQISVTDPTLHTYSQRVRLLCSNRITHIPTKKSIANPTNVSPGAALASLKEK
jgi:hypothetical protein